jgi:transcriptional regulator with XRE-family HTH domain
MGQAMMLTTGNQLRAARSLVNMDQGTLAERAGVNINTIGSMEKREADVLTSGLDKVTAVMRVLEAAGIEFLNHGQPGVRLRSPTSRPDGDLLELLEKDMLWIIRHAGADHANTLRRALQKCADLVKGGNYVTSVRSLDDRIVIEPDQIKRLFKQLRFS